MRQQIPPRTETNTAAVSCLFNWQLPLFLFAAPSLRAKRLRPYLSIAVSPALVKAIHLIEFVLFDLFLHRARIRGVRAAGHATVTRNH
jgi:hypothetical protein